MGRIPRGFFFGNFPLHFGDEFWDFFGQEGVGAAAFAVLPAPPRERPAPRVPRQLQTPRPHHGRPADALRPQLAQRPGDFGGKIPNFGQFQGFWEFGEFLGIFYGVFGGACGDFWRLWWSLKGIFVVFWEDFWGVLEDLEGIFGEDLGNFGGFGGILGLFGVPQVNFSLPGDEHVRGSGDGRGAR